MIKPMMPNIPGMGAMTDTLEFVKNLWGSMGIPGMSMPGMNMAGMNVPGMVMPTLSVEEINKRITDLKAVESWLTLNMSMLRSGIQALEVQAATITTLQTMGETFAASMNPAAKESPAEQTASTFSAGSNGPAGGNGHATEKLHGAPEPTQEDESEAAALTAPLVNAAAWWNMLQDQFKQAVNTAMSEVPAASAKPVEKPKAKPKAKAKAAAPAKSATTRKRSPRK